MFSGGFNACLECTPALAAADASVVGEQNVVSDDFGNVAADDLGNVPTSDN